MFFSWFFNILNPGENIRLIRLFVNFDVPVLGTGTIQK